MEEARALKGAISVLLSQVHFEHIKYLITIVGNFDVHWALAY